MDADINEANWHPECSVLVRDLKVRVYVKKKDGLDAMWQSMWFAADTWMALHWDITTAVLNNQRASSNQQNARTFGGTSDCSSGEWGLGGSGHVFYNQG